MRGMSPLLGGQQTPGPRLLETYRCPHGFVSTEHRAWGQNFEQPWVEEAWAQGYTTAYGRMLEEAGTAGAHGVIGVVDHVANVADTGDRVPVPGHRGAGRRGGPPRPAGVPWTTYLAGQRLTKSIEAGLCPGRRWWPRWPRCGSGPTA